MKLLLALWWAFTWRSAIATVVSALVGFAVGSALASLLPTANQYVVLVLSAPIGLALSTVPFWLLLERGFSKYRLIIATKEMPHADVPADKDHLPAAKSAVTIRSVISLWWAYLWRYVCCMFAAQCIAAAVSYLLSTLLNNNDERILMAIEYSVAAMASVVPFWLLLNRGFGNYRLTVVAIEPATLPSTNRAIAPRAKHA